MDLSAQDIIARLRSRGVRLVLRDGALGYEGPKGEVNAATLAELRLHKDELLRAVAAAESEATGPKLPSKRFSISGDRPQHAPMIDLSWKSDHPYYRYVEPYKGYLLHRLRMDKRFTTANGVWMHADDGSVVLDSLSQYGALPFGHNPPEIWRAIMEARDASEPAFAANTRQDSAGELAERLIALWPEAGFENVVFTNSGAEALEAAIKLSRAATGRHGMLATTGGFHGLTVGALGLGGSAVYREGFASDDGGMQVPWGDVDALERALTSQPQRFAAFVVEPIQGEAGIIDPPAGYLAAARRICDRTGALLILDEVQSGLGRTGDMFAAQRENVVPDIMTLAKALGGGLMPIGACVYRPTARSERFGLRHSSTFAGGTLACRAGLAAISRLTADDSRLVRQVRDNGEFLRAGLQSLRSRYPRIVSGSSGRGYMQGLRLNFGQYWQMPGLLGLLHDQNILIHLVVSHLLNVGNVRVAPSFSAGDVLRIQPPLIAERDHLQMILSALDVTLGALDAGDTRTLLEHLGDFEPNGTAIPAAPQSERRLTPQLRQTPPDIGRFGFIVHPLSNDDFVRLDPAIAHFDPKTIGRFVRDFANFIDPRPIEGLELVGADGARAYGELILVPFTPADMIAMQPAKALAEIELAVRTAQARGARVVGLGGFSSIVAQGGLAFKAKDLPAITSGNSFTATATRQLLLAACRRRGLAPERSSVAVVGAGGMVGRALSILLASDFHSMILVGNVHRARYLERSAAMALDLIRSLATVRHLCETKPGSLASFLMDCPADEDGAALLNRLQSEGRLVSGEPLETCVPRADAIALATSSIDTILLPHHLKADAIVCDVSRPFNVHPSVAIERPDVHLTDAGLVRTPPGCGTSLHAGPKPGLIYACAAETMIWALERAYDRVTPDGCMEISSVLMLEALALKHGFRTEGVE